ncbi:MAG: M99 family carboxypeptidase catalytic domain-containing protein, partial [Desulfovibrionaceae bacterium]|nr:M99 family carboxypeptidase catalytic domain-containing protein [Desulfovibrionaceae bacterium]
MLCLPAPLPAQTGFPLDFSIFRLGHAERVALVIGGIQGDEPGGFSAATLLATRYEIQKGAVWVVPNLNFPSIIRRSRGVYGDMNRKFALLDKNDPEFPTVRRIQELIRQPAVGLVLNLHDGSGYYRPAFESKLCSPARWGQSVIIDQADLPQAFMGSLAEVATAVTEEVNRHLLAPLHKLHVHNTRTAEGDREMEKSLSYYAVRQGKAAFGLEASKEFPVALRAYYHLHMVEAFLRQAGICFSRDFELTPKGVAGALRSNLGVSFADNRIFLPLEDVREQINYLPLPRGSHARAVTSKPIMAVLPCRGQGQEEGLCIHYGNRIITLIRPDWRDMDDSLAVLSVTVDGRQEQLSFGQ